MEMVSAVFGTSFWSKERDGGAGALDSSFPFYKTSQLTSGCNTGSVPQDGCI